MPQFLLLSESQSLRSNPKGVGQSLHAMLRSIPFVGDTKELRTVSFVPLLPIALLLLSVLLLRLRLPTAGHFIQWVRHGTEKASEIDCLKEQFI